MSKVASGKSTAADDTVWITKDVVIEAISTLNDRTGSSLSAIKKFIEGKHPSFNIDSHLVFIKKFLKKSLEDGSIKNSKGQGLAGK